jgi:hypothetical protein
MKKSILLAGLLTMMTGGLFLTMSWVLTGCQAQLPAIPSYVAYTSTSTGTPTNSPTPTKTPTCAASWTPGCGNQFTRTPTRTPTPTITPAD